MQFFNKQIETLPRPELQALQLEKLQNMLEKIYGRNRFYTQKMQSAGINPGAVHSVHDLAAFPFTTKDELMRAQADSPPFGTNATYPETAYTRFHQTSGTTGTPLRVLDTNESWDWWGRCWGFVLAGAGVTASDRLFVPFSFGPFIGFWAAVAGAKQIGALMIPGGGRNSLQRLHLMKELGATVICCTPTYALRLAEVARDAAFKLEDLPVRTTIHAGEPGANVPATKARIEAAWGAKCFDHAGASEVGAHSFECGLQPGGTHVIESEFIVEVVDPKTGDPVSPGKTGELIITNLGRIGYPVIRYRTRDLVRLSHEPCECGRTLARFEGGVLGRTDDMVIIRGVNVFPSAIENLVRRFETVEEFRIVISSEHKMAVLNIEVEITDPGNEEKTRQAVEQTIQQALGLHPNVVLAKKGSLPRFELKAKRLFIQTQEAA